MGISDVSRFQYNDLIAEGPAQIASSKVTGNAEALIINTLDELNLTQQKINASIKNPQGSEKLKALQARLEALSQQLKGLMDVGISSMKSQYDQTVSMLQKFSETSKLAFGGG